MLHEVAQLSVEQASLRRRPAGRQPGAYDRGVILVEMGENLLDDRRIFDAGESLPRERSDCFGHDPYCPAAGLADLNVDAKYSLHALRLYALWVQVMAARR